MSSRSHPHVVAVGRRRTGGRRITVAAVRRRARSWRRTLRALLTAFLTLPITAQILITVAAIVLAALAANWAYHTIRKPTEVFFPLTNALDKQPFRNLARVRLVVPRACDRRHHTDLLAALAQVESAGNPVARTYWRGDRPGIPWNSIDRHRARWACSRLPTRPFRKENVIAFTTIGWFKTAAGTTCNPAGLTASIAGVLPSHAIELTAAMLDRAVDSAIRQSRRAHPTFRQKQDLAAVIHLCGAGAGHAYVARGFRLAPHQRCGDHSARSYLDRVHDMKRKFARLAAGESLLRFVRPR